MNLQKIFIDFFRTKIEKLVGESTQSVKEQRRFDIRTQTFSQMTTNPGNKSSADDGC